MTNEEAKENLIKDGHADNETAAESIISDIKASLSYTGYISGGVVINIELYNSIKGPL